jgi:hypothetical protein
VDKSMCHMLHLLLLCCRSAFLQDLSFLLTRTRASRASAQAYGVRLKVGRELLRSARFARARKICLIASLHMQQTLGAANQAPSRNPPSQSSSCVHSSWMMKGAIIRPRTFHESVRVSPEEGRQAQVRDCAYRTKTGDGVPGPSPTAALQHRACLPT